MLTERLAGARRPKVERAVELVGLTQDGEAARDAASARRERSGGVLRLGGRAPTAATAACAPWSGSELEGSFKGERFLLADVEAEHDYDPRHMHMFFTPEGPFMLFPMPGRRVRLMAQLDGRARRDAAPAQGDPGIADERAGGIRVTGAHWLSRFEIHHGQVPALPHGPRVPGRRRRPHPLARPADRA